MKYLESARELIRIALKEDVGSGDVTSESIIPKNQNAEGILSVKQDGIVAGVEVFCAVFDEVSYGAFDWQLLKKDGNRVASGDSILRVSGGLRTMLTVERTALNFIRRMSGVATLTNRFAQALKGTKTNLLDTRKTIPGFRMLDKYAIRVGGGTNHRIGLFDMVMIKDNHSISAGGIEKAVELVNSRFGSKYKIEVETENLDDVREALDAGADVIMLDNMSIEEMSAAVRLVNGKAKTEASGNVGLHNIREIAETGIDYISVGAVTHSAPALDLSFNIEKNGAEKCRTNRN